MKYSICSKAKDLITLMVTGMLEVADYISNPFYQCLYEFEYHLFLVIAASVWPSRSTLLSLPAFCPRMLICIDYINKLACPLAIIESKVELQQDAGGEGRRVRGRSTYPLGSQSAGALQFCRND